ncbi:hypothetical protein RhiirC2_711462 [Rhizophagus irregularis]|uniref:Uncharacterized protein n=1 Tax=Rhizophagus irregularis TaxID=588596 RepID=A0A2N1NAT5_9GLOM|nr:hypothetical protein RhiirC2_711462 [Rhizophagus irregularis]
MDQEDDEFTWDNFRAGLDHEIERLKLKDRTITKRKHVDHVWDSLRQLIMKSANDNIRNKKVIEQKFKGAPEKKLRMFKNKLKFARSAPNAILNNPYIYGYRDFYDNQLQAKITDFCIQLNDNGLLGKITEIRLISLQDQLWTSCPLIEKLPYNRVPHTRKNNYILNMLLLCYDNNISLENLDDNTFPSIKGGKIPLEDVVDNAYYSKYRMRLREKNILFLDQIISGDTSRLLLWKEILIKAYIPVFSQRKETKWYSDIRNLITSDGVHLNYNITQLFGAHVDNVEEARSYNITKKNRSLIAVYNSQFNSVVIGKIQGIDETQRPIIKHFHIDMSRCTDTHTYIYQCMEYGCAANASLSTRSPCTA